MTLYHNGERNAKMDIVALKYDFFLSGQIPGILWKFSFYDF